MKRLARRLSVLVAAVLALASLAEAAWACSCVRYRSAAEQLARADAVFRGRVVASERAGPQARVTTFEVVEGLKGRTGRRVRVRHGTETAAGCGVVFRRGQVVALTAHLERGRWTTSSCSMPQHPWAEFRRAARRG